MVRRMCGCLSILLSPLIQNQFADCSSSLFLRLEDTLIDLYLSGYSNKEVHDGADKTTSSKANEVEMLEFQADGLSFSPLHRWLSIHMTRTER